MPVRSLQPSLDQSAARALSVIRAYCEREHLRPTTKDVASELRQPVAQTEPLIQTLCQLGWVERVKSARGVVLVMLDLAG